MPIPFLTWEEWRRLEENQEPRDFTIDGIQVTTTQTPLLDSKKTLLTMRTYRGTGERALLFLHDHHRSGAVYEALARMLAAQGCIVHLLTLRGYGSGVWYSQTNWQSGEGIILWDHLSDVESVIEAQGLAPELLTIVGEGMGGILAQLYARQRKVAGLVLLNAYTPHRAAQAWGRRAGWARPKAKASVPDGILEDYQQLAAQGFQPLQASHVLVLTTQETINPKLLAATARDYHVEAVRIQEPDLAALATQLLQFAEESHP
jgi:pimeloyl-ACP methyl ester carboxylesterase